MSNISINNDLEVSEEIAEILACKQLLNPIDQEFSAFINQHFDQKFFKNQQRKLLFRVGKAYWKKYEKIPSDEVINAILSNQKYSEHRKDYLDEYKNIISLDESKYESKYVKDILIKFTKMKQIYFTMLEQFDDIEKNGDIGDCLSRFEKIVQIDMGDDIGIEYFENLDNHCNQLISITDREKFGFKELDKYTYGGLPTNDACLFVIMAKPGLGKSQLMMNIAYNWVMKNKKVLMVSLEMSQDMYSRRMDGLFTDINVNQLKENVGLVKSRVKGIKLNIPKSQLRIKEFPTGTMTASQLKMYLKKLKATVGFEPDLICVDYLNIMKPNSSNGNMALYEKCARIAEELRAISCELKVPIVSATQSNRCAQGGGYAGADISMENVSESSGITATADALIALYQLQGEHDVGRINVKILKNRLGGYNDRTFPLKVDYNTLKISDAESSEQSSTGDKLLDDCQDANQNLIKKTKKEKQDISKHDDILNNI